MSSPDPTPRAKDVALTGLAGLLAAAGAALDGAALLARAARLKQSVPLFEMARCVVAIEEELGAALLKAVERLDGPPAPPGLTPYRPDGEK